MKNNAILVLFFCLAGNCPANAQSGIIATVAGNGNFNFSGDGGPARSASLSYPNGVAVDTAGNLFIADSNNNMIRRVSISGVITTVAGNEIAGYSGDGGPATAASLNFPTDVTVDASGNLYIADLGNSRIRKVSATGVIATVAGNGTSGFSGDGGQAISAAFGQISSITVDSSDNLFVADAPNRRVRKVSTSGIITTVAGNGTSGFSGDNGSATSASLSYPTGVTVDTAGNLFVADAGNLRIRKVSASGIITTVAGDGSYGFSGDGGPATSASLNYPDGVAVDASGNLFIADTDNSRIRKVSANGIITTVAGNGISAFAGDGGPATSASLSYPNGVAVDGSGDLFIADSENSRIREVLPQSVPIVISANNSADYSTTVAQGSLFVVFGSSLGPATLANVTAFPLPNILAGTSVTVTSGSTTLNCPMIYTSTGQVAAILPSNTPVGSVTITVTYNGVTGPYGVSSTQATVVPTSEGIYTVTSSGLGTGIFTSPGYALETFTSAAQPGEIVTAWGTGIGPITTPDNVLPTSFPSYPNVQAWVGGQSAQIVYAGRSGCCAAVDQIAFTVPAIANGCNVPVVVVSGGVPSNTVTIPVSSSGGPCSDSGPTLPTTFLTKADAGQPVKVAALAIGPAITQNGVVTADAVAKRLSATLHTKVTEEEAAKLIRAYKSHNARAIRSAMAQYAPQWKALSARVKARVAADLSQAQQGAGAIFGTYSGEALAAMVASAQLPTAGSCVVLPQDITSGLGAVSAGLDAGPALSLTGAAGSMTMNEAYDREGQYHASFPSSVTGPDVPAGSYAISGTGGKDVGAFSATISVGSPIAISNKVALTTVDRTQPLTLTWTGGVAGNYILIGGYTPHTSAQGVSVANAYFTCAADAGSGTFTIPSYILSSMNPTAAGKGVVAISPHPLSNQITIPGLDLAYFIDGSSDSVNVTFQ